ILVTQGPLPKPCARSFLSWATSDPVLTFIEVSIFIKDGLAVSCSGRGRPPLCRDRCTITSSSHGDLTTRLGPLVRDCLFVRQACLFRSSPLSNRVLSTQLPEAVPLSATCGRARYL